MAQVITRCRLTGHYMFIAMDVDPKEFGNARGPFTRQFCPFCTTEHVWHKEDARYSCGQRPKSAKAFSARADGASVSCQRDCPKRANL